jgi:hypothetical protein
MNKFLVPNGFEHRFVQQVRRCVHTISTPNHL